MRKLTDKEKQTALVPVNSRQSLFPVGMRTKSKMSTTELAEVGGAFVDYIEATYRVISFMFPGMVEEPRVFMKCPSCGDTIAVDKGIAHEIVYCNRCGAKIINQKVDMKE